MAKKNKHDLGKIATRIMAAVLAGLMLLGTIATLIYYLVG